MSVNLKRHRINIAMKREKSDLVIKNANIVNVFTKEIIKGDIAIYKDQIVGIGNYSGVREIDAEGKYVCPGFIDSHMHIESTMVTPGEFAKSIIPHGTTTLIADPHEIANVCGINGINFMLNQSKGLPLNIYYMMPSSVPSTSFENNGADLTAELIEPFLSNDKILGLGEVMDYPAVTNGHEKMLKKIDLFDNKIIDGHSPNLTGEALNAYRTAGIMTDHECSTIGEALERLRLGMYLQIREGSGARNLKNLVEGLIKHHMSFERCIFCTDDKHLEDIRKEGHISYNIKKAVKYGVNPIDAICMATINSAQCYKLKRLGAVAPGYSADILILNNLQDLSIDKVFYRGKVIYENKKVCTKINIKIDDNNVLNTVRLQNITIEDLKIKIENNTAEVIELLPHELITKKRELKVKTLEGNFVADELFSKIAVIERHKATKNIGLGIVSNFNIKNGAIASTVAHDSHNLIVIGDNDRDMLLAIDEIKKVNGGYTVVSNGKIKGTLPLPVAGLMSDKSSEYVETTLNKMLEEALKLGINKNIDPFITLSFLALPVIPEIRITDKGLFDVTQFKFI
ncbi:adenine deaminase [Clostridium pasteurianum DSM 525 = ATCC 6013]|uniref:Adenine deaminase n=1 Tax=Clostridium pasteurianum DSM 525 = ATCC 6013 TaxID=1262449 RepID=A0A0H3J7C6_CLOPA|nr:adenine deaminase [Clostridium pasteurianum]AJA49379.1 adenine deaminase [Clostridium pasteurianum DSM 525 = ATCC 6013]AJA53367.1 adenine deaminase [Clostridium pasteurianum DSM 525 = ATCC 6013]AOZ76551.1 adenosine deaminase [Clostridium pasteurianum DSM 525 = ATCC 6013]AOZ80348.1 adenosine deaminase [Clostridium pasteurianum]ELP58505.1 adenine deaminase [Clostridium pasteurianum DSM 525 = ATCC 6013]